MSEVVFGLLEIVIAAVARRHHRVEAHLLRDREVAGGEIGLQLGIEVLHLHGAATIPVLELDKLEPQRLAHLFGRAVIGVPCSLEGATRVVRDFAVLAGHRSAPFPSRPSARRCATRRSPRYSPMAARARLQPRVRGCSTPASPRRANRPIGSRLTSPRTKAMSQSWNSDCPVRAKNCRMTRPSSILPVAKTCSEKTSSNAIDGFLVVCPLSSSQCAVAFITPSGLTSRGQA